MRARIEKISPGVEASFIYKRRSDPRFEFSWHFHPEYELTWIVRSRGRRFVGDGIAPYAEGDLVLLGADLPHTWCSDPSRRGRHEAVVVQFRHDFLGRGFFDRPELAEVRRLLERSARGLRFAGRAQRAAARGMEEMGRLRGAERVAALLGVLARLARARDAAALSSPGFVPSLRRADAGRIDRAFRFIHGNFAGGLTLVEAAAAVPMSVPAFCRFFRRKTGKTFTQYVNELRVGETCRLLVETDRTVLQASLESGFNNLSHFNRRFRALRGMSPREYRRQFAQP